MNVAIRAFVVALALTGAAATVSTVSTNSNSPSLKPVAVRTSAMPIPRCAPSDIACQKELGY